jgi:hypothetical protein
MAAILIQNVAGTPLTTIPTTDTAFYTNNIQPTEYQNVRVVVPIEINTTGTSLLANIAIKLKITSNASTTVLKILNYQTPAALAGTNNQHLEWCGDLSQGGVLSVTASTAVADTHTTITAKALYVTSVD